jgi:hypothetical protein
VLGIEYSFENRAILRRMVGEGAQQKPEELLRYDCLKWLTHRIGSAE